ncbi:MAG: protein phosphatase 2C domain-containing protein [Bacteroidales bacterium]|nr:protein phosphatase 2C domain-containing protein [Bacteroidales bacterium]
MIYISTVSRRGSSHADCNEDSFYYKQSDNVITGGIFDGCSSGKDSYFASKLFANVFRKTIDEYAGGITMTKDLKLITHAFFKNLKKTANYIGLIEEETLSTAILFLYETETGNLKVKFFGDGVAYVNNDELKIYKIDENNQPDYVAYSLNNIIETENFRKYWDLKKSVNITTKDFSISSDGIFSYKKSNGNEDFPVETFLAQDNFLYKNPASLKRKLNMIKNKGYDHYDDITIIRIINE